MDSTRRSLNLGAIVLAGGRATRLDGAAKPLLRLEGETLVARTVTAARNAGAEDVVIVGPADVAVPGTRRVREDPPFAGPAAGIVAALEAAAEGDDSDWTLVLVADLEHPAAVVRALVGALPTDGSDGVRLVDPAGRPQWLTGVYRTTALRAAAAALPERGVDASARRLLEPIPATAVPASDDDVADLDTWEDVARTGARLPAHDPAPPSADPAPARRETS